jgi:hypothetical protein
MVWPAGDVAGWCPVTMPWSNQSVSLIVIIAGGAPFTGLFIYSGAPAAGKLIFSVSPADGTDPFGNAFKTQATTYQSPGTGVAAGLVAGGLSMYTGPVSGAGPWTTQFTTVAASPAGVQMNALQNGGTIGITSGSPSGGGGVGGAGTTIDGLMYGGQIGFYTSGSSTSYHGTTLTADPFLTVSGLFGSAAYRFRLVVIYDGANGAGQLKWNVANDVAATGHATMIYEGTTGAQVTNADAFPLSGHSANTVGVGSFLGLTMDGIMYTAASTTSCTMQFAQVATNATNTTIYDGSYLLLERCG